MGSIQKFAWEWLPVFQIAGAAGTCIAVLIALFRESLIAWWTAPLLHIGWRGRDAERLEFHPLDDENLVVHPRLSVTNDGRTPALDVQVTVADVYRQKNAAGEYEIVRFVPTGLKWTHTESAHCALIPSRSTRLCDLGIYQDKSTATSNQETFTFATEIVPKSGYHILPAGIYFVRVIASASNCRTSIFPFFLSVGTHTLSPNGELLLFSLSAMSKATRKQIRLLDKNRE